MGAFVSYFLAHPWQRRVLTLSVTMLTASIVGFFALPHIRDYMLLKDLASPQPAVRTRGIAWGIAWAQQSKTTVPALERALDAAGDEEFRAIVTVLRGVNKFDTSGRDPNQIDRLRLVDFTSSRPDPDSEALALTRRLILQQVIASRRDDAYIRKFLAAAVTDPSSGVREDASLLAARLKDFAALGTLLADANAAVQSSAAMDAGLAGAKELKEQIARLIPYPRSPDVVSSCADALIRLSPDFALEVLVPAKGEIRICSPTERSDNRPLANCSLEDVQILRERMIYCLQRLPDANRVAATVAPGLAMSNYYKIVPRAMDLLVGERVKMPEAGMVAKLVLRTAAAGRAEISEEQLLAAIDAAGRMNLPVRAQVDAIIRRLWSPQLSLTMMAAVDLLRQQADLPQPADANAPSRDDCLRTLRLAATYQYVPATVPAATEPTATEPSASGPATSEPAATEPATADLAASKQAASEPAMMNTPLASAAAAAALWQLAPATTYATREGGAVKLDMLSSAYYVYSAASAEQSGPADYIAWRLAESNNPLAFELGLELLPPPVDSNVPLDRQPPRDYSANARAAGAMLLGLAARTPKQRAVAAERIGYRLAGGALGVTPSFYDAGTYRCALLCLGDANQLPEVRQLLREEFPARRVLTALVAAGDRTVLDWLLGDLQDRPEDIEFFLIDSGCGEVLAKAVPELPAVDPFAPQEIRLWQVKLMQHYYVIHRETIQFASIRSTGVPPVSHRGILPLYSGQGHGRDARETHGQDGRATKDEREIQFTSLH